MERITFIFILAILSATLVLAFTIVTSKINGPRLYMYDVWISYSSIINLESRNTSYILLPGKLSEEQLASMDQHTGNGIWIRRLEPVSFNMVPVLIFATYCVYTFFKTEQSQQGVAKINDDDEYSQEIIQEHAFWHMLYIICMAIINLVLITYLCNPVELVVAVFISMVVALQTDMLIMPRPSDEPTALNTFGRMFSGSAILLSWIFIYSQLRDYDGIAMPFVIRIMMEVFMIIGHTGKEMRMGAVMECRSMYVFLNGLFIVVMYSVMGKPR